MSVSALAVALSVGGGLIAVLLIVTAIAYCLFRRKKKARADDPNENNNVQRLSMNSENFSHVTNLRKLEPLEVVKSGGKPVPKRTKPTLDQKLQKKKADDLSDVDLSLFSEEGQLNPAFVDDEETTVSLQLDDVKLKEDGNVVVFKLEGVVKFDVSQIVAMDKNRELTLDNQRGGHSDNIITTNGDIRHVPVKFTPMPPSQARSSDGCVITMPSDDKSDGTNSKPLEINCDGSPNEVHDSNNADVSEYTRDREYHHDGAEEIIAPQQDTICRAAPVTSAQITGNDKTDCSISSTNKRSNPNIVSTSFDDDEADNYSEEQILGPVDFKEQGENPDAISEAVDVEDVFIFENSEDDSDIGVKGREVIEKAVSISRDIPPGVSRRKQSVCCEDGKERTTILIRDLNSASIRTGTHGRHDKVVFRPNPNVDQTKSYNRKRHIDIEQELNGKEIDIPVEVQAGSSTSVKSKKLRHTYLGELSGIDISSPILRTEPSFASNGNTMASKPRVTREGSVYDVPWDMTDVGALLMQLNDIRESEGIGAEGES